MVEIHNYQNASSRAQKLTNWTTLNRKFSRNSDLPSQKKSLMILFSQKMT